MFWSVSFDRLLHFHAKEMIKPGSCLYAESTQQTYKRNTFGSAHLFFQK